MQILAHNAFFQKAIFGLAARNIVKSALLPALFLLAACAHADVASVKTVQTGSVDMAAGGGTVQIVTLPTAVNAAMAYVVGYVEGNADSNAQMLCTFELNPAGTQVTITPGANAGITAWIAKYQVIEFANGVSVQRGLDSTDFPGGEAAGVAKNIVISGATAGKSFALLTVRTPTNNGGQNDSLNVAATITSTTNLALQRDTSNYALAVAWQVVTFTDSTTLVQSGSVAKGGNNGNNTPFNATLSPAVNLSQSFLVFSLRTGNTGTAGAEDKMCVRGIISTTTNVAFQEAQGTSKTITCSWFVISNPNFTVLTGTPIMASGTTSSDITIANTTLSASMALINVGIGFNLAANGDITALDDASIVPSFTNATTLHLERKLQTAATNEGDISYFVVTFPVAVAAAPTITGVSPTTGPNTGAFNFTINGTNLSAATLVQFTYPTGGTTVTATNVQAISGTQLTCNLPAAYPYTGPADITLTNTGFPPVTLPGTSSSPQGFSYTSASAPTVSAISPPSGPTAGGEGVMITGTGFAPTATVSIGGVAATGVNVNSNTSLTATVPAGTAGYQNVTVTNPDAQTGTLINSYLYVTSATVVTTAQSSNAQLASFFPAGNNLIAGKSPSVNTNGSAGSGGSGAAVTLLTDKLVVANTVGSSYTIGSNASITYSLGANAAGYDVTAINAYTSWNSNAQTSPNFTVSYSTAAAPNTFAAIPGATVNVAATAGTLSVAVNMAVSGLTGVANIRFNFGTQTNAYTGFGELEAVGVPTISATTLTWNGSTSLNWGDAGNWNINGTAAGRAPQNGDIVVLTGSGTFQPTNMNIAGLSIPNLVFDATTTTPIIVATLNASSLTVTNVITVDPAAANHTLDTTLGLILGGAPVSINVGPSGAGKSFTIAGVISGVAANALTSYGPGTLSLLNVANTYLGATIVGGPSTLQPVFLANGGLPSSIGQSSNASASLVLLGGTLSYTGASVTIDRGFSVTSDARLNITTAGTTLETTGTGIGTAGVNAVLSFVGPGTFKISGTNDNVALDANVIAGTVLLNKTSNGGVHSLAILVIVGGTGTIQITGTGGDQIYDNTVVLVNTGGTFDLNGANESIAALGGSGGTVTNSSATSNSFFTIGNATGSSANTFPGVIQDGATMKVSLAKAGAATQTLTGANTFTGGTQISAGILSVNTISDSGTSALGPAASGVTLTGGTLQYTGTAAVTTTRSFNALGTGTGGTLDVNNAAGVLNINSQFSFTAQATVNKVGAGTLSLQGATGNTNLIANVQAGTLALAKTSSATVHAVDGISAIVAGATVKITGTGGDQILGSGPTGPAGLVNMGGGTFDLGGQSESIDRLFGTGVVTNSVSSSTSTLTLGESNGGGTTFGTTYTGTIVNGGGGTGIVNLAKVGTGTVVLSNTANSYGTTSVTNAGTLASTVPGALGNGAITLNANATLDAGTLIPPTLGGFGVSGTGWSKNGGAAIASDVATLTDNNGNEARSVFPTSKVAYSGGFTASFVYTLVNPNNTPADGVTFCLQNVAATTVGNNGGGLGYVGMLTSYAITINVYNATQAGGSQIGTGVNGVQQPQVTTTGVNLASGDPIQFTVTYNSTAQTVVVNLKDLTTNGTFTNTYTAQNIATSVTGTTCYVGFTGGTGGANCTETISNFAYNSGTPNTPVTVYPNNVSIQGPASNIKVTVPVGTTTLTLGTLALASGATFNVLPSANTASGQSYGLTFGATTLAGPTVNVANNGAGTGVLTLGALNDGGTVQAITLNAGGTTTGSLVLSAPANTLSNSTGISVAGGTLKLGAATVLGATPNVTVASGATLDGNGQTIGGTVRGLGSMINALAFTPAGARLWPGTTSSVASLNANELLTGANVDLSGGGKLSLILHNANSHSQSLNLSGALTLGGTSSLSLGFDAPSTVPVQYTVVTTAAGGIANAFNGVLAGTMQYGNDYDVIYTDGTTPTVSPAPGATITPAANQIIVKFKSSAVTPVKIESFAAMAQGAGAMLEWTAISEYQNLGFNVYRRAVQEPRTPVSGWQRVNSALISGRITNADAKTYRVYDWAAPGMYEYKLESVSVRGVSETYAKVASAVIEAFGAELSAEGFDAAVSSVGTAKELKLGATLSAKFASEPRTSVGGQSSVTESHEPRLHGSGNAALAFDAQGKLTLPAASVRALNPNDAPPGQAAKPVASGTNLDGLGGPSYAASARWFSTGTSKPASYTGAKVVYNAPGVLLIPQAMLPAGFNAKHLSIVREGVSMTALAVTSDGLVVFAPGYQDDYTDKDAIFLRNTSGATAAGQIPHANGLFAGTQAVNTQTPAAVTSTYHDVYFDFSLRPFTFAPWFSSQYLTDGTDQSFSVSTPNASSGAASLTVNLWSLTQVDGVSPDHALQVLVNGQPVGQATWSGGNTMMQIAFQIPSGVLTNGANQIDLVTPTLDGVASQISFLHSMTIGYTKSLDGSTPLDVYNLSAYSKLFEIRNVPSNIVWVVDARYPDRAALAAYESQAQANGTYTLRFNAASGGTGHYLVVPAAQENLPISVTKRQVAPVKAMTYMPVGPAQFSSAVQPLLMQRAKEGLRGSFVDQEQIFDYYNYGRYGPAGIQNAVRSVRPQYLLLLGRTTYDYRNYSGLGVDPLCPTFLVSTTFWAQATSDSMFGDLGRGYPEIAVGRLPVNDAGELSNAVTHVLSNTGLTTGYRVHAAADRADPDAGDFAGEADAIAQAHPDLMWQPNYLGVTYQTSPEVTAALTAAANGGADLLMYIGHGNAVRLGNEVPRILDNDMVSAWTGSAVFLQSTCTANWMAKNETGYQSIAIQALTQPQGGISASIASSTYMNSQNATEFMSQLLTNAGTTQRWGNALLKTQQWAYAKGGGFYIDLSNTEQIFGDPAMPVLSKAAAAPAGGPTGAKTGGSSGSVPGQF
ncbi:MAG TPA: C25 family cysteine peptidase [Planctomycetota bacterium]|nr:C25 family cysteine peptidase [Planctomycetota bacterium]